MADRHVPLAPMSDVALGMFLAMSLMSLQLWTLSDMAGPIVSDRVRVVVDSKGVSRVRQ